MELRREIISLASMAGAAHTGFARAEEVDAAAHERYLEFLSEGRHGAMGYMANHLAIRRNPKLLLENGDARTLIVMAFPYFTPDNKGDLTDARFAMYARGSDYHSVIRNRLGQLTEFLENRGFKSRICIDSAPLRERYWAVRAGIGFIGVNSQLIIPGEGSYFFLATIITEAEISPDQPCTGSCGECGRCVAACPGGAIGADGSFDARKCLSYLTIEYRGELPEGLRMGNNVYGCDSCQSCCPHNRCARPTDIGEFKPRDEVTGLTRRRIAEMTREEFSRIFKDSAVKRTRLEGLKRNALYFSPQVERSRLR